jgi:penicillin-binding protein 1C
VTLLRRIAAMFAKALAFVSAAAILALGVLWASTDLDAERFARPEDGVTIADRNGTPLRHHRPNGVDRRWVPLDGVSPHLIGAIVAVEDHRFYAHRGVDPRSIARASLSAVLPGRRLSGASTITQQLVKRVYGRPHGLWDKPREIVRALRLERERDKAWILEQYVNRLPYGDSIAGVERASMAYFGKPASELDLAEAALLAGIPQAPSALDPRRHLPRAIRRQRLVLRRMRETGAIDEQAYQAALAAPITIRAGEVRPWRAPRFADRALVAWREGELDRSGGVVHTSLDLALDAQAERIVRRAVSEHAARGVTNGAAVVVSNDTGEILAYVGAARSGAEHEGGWLDLLEARRQPGSTLKPFVYELYFERGGTAASVLDDLSRPMTGEGGALFDARNYDGAERGPVRARVALASSLNLAALDAARQVGPERIVARLRALGMGHLEGPEHYGAAIVIGGADASPLDLAEAYVALARGGTRVPLALRARPRSEPVRVMDAAAARITRDVLSDGRARREAFGDDLRSELDGPFALKTGTSSGWRDAWTVAFTDRFTVVVWLGDPHGRPLAGLSGFRGAARPAVRILAAAEARAGALQIPATPREDPPLAQARVCALTGQLAGPRCAHAVDERFAHGTVPHERCDAHREDGSIVLGPRYARWVERAQPAGFSIAEPEGQGAITIEHPRDGSRLFVDARRASIPLRASERGARWEIDGTPIDGDAWAATEGDHTIVAVLEHERSAPSFVHVSAQ